LALACEWPVISTSSPVLDCVEHSLNVSHAPSCLVFTGYKVPSLEFTSQLRTLRTEVGQFNSLIYCTVMNK